MNRMTTTLFGLALIVLLCGAASAAQINVNQTGWWNATGDTTFHAIDPGQIQAAIDNATAGDTIYVYNGTYNENVKVNKWLTLEGEGADVVTVTAAATNYGVFDVTADYVNITGFNVTGATDSAAGVYLSGADHCNISDNIASGNYLGIWLYDSCDNTLTGNDCTGNACGIYLYVSSNNNTLTENICSGNTYGILLLDNDNNTLTGNDCTGNACGIYLWDSSNDNTLTGNDCSGNTGWGFYSDEYAHNNTVKDLTVASYPTTISFTYENGIAIKGVETAPPDPAEKVNISKYVNATNVTAGSWLFLNVSYNESDLGGVDENSLRMWKHNGTDWTEVPGTNGVNTAENYVYANITEFSVFAPLGIDVCDQYDGCYEYGDGCEDRDYFWNGTGCEYTYSNRHTDYCTDWIYYCDGDTVWKEREFHDFHCDGGTCVEDVIPENEFVEDCPSDYCTDWAYYCDGDTVWRSREFHDFHCDGGTCVEDVIPENEFVEDCNDCDAWVGTGNTSWIDDPENECKEKKQKEQEYHDYTCSGGRCDYSVTDTQWIDTGNMRNKPDGTICGCTANNTLKKCDAGNCSDTGICNSTYCDADAACDGKNPGEVCGTDSTCNSTCNCVALATAPPIIISFAPPSPVNDTVCHWRTFNVTVNQTVNVSWYLHESFLHTNESVTEANYTLHAEVTGEHNVSAVATNANGTDMQTWIWNVTEAPTSPLNLSKTDDVFGCVNVDATITYTICYDNLANPDVDVHNVTINDTLPAGVTFVSASGGVLCVDGIVTWTIGDLAAGAPAACVTLNVTVDAGTEGQTLTNCATIKSDETDPATACVTTDVCGITPEPVPTFTPPGIALMIGLLAVAGSVVLRRRE